MPSLLSLLKSTVYPLCVCVCVCVCVRVCVCVWVCVWVCVFVNWYFNCIILAVMKVKQNAVHLQSHFKYARYNRDRFCDDPHGSYPLCCEWLLSDLTGLLRCNSSLGFCYFRVINANLIGNTQMHPYYGNYCVFVPVFTIAVVPSTVSGFLDAFRALISHIFLTWVKPVS